MASQEQFYSATPTSRVGFKHTYRKSDDLNQGFVRPRDNRSFSGSSTNGARLGVQHSSTGVAPMPGSFIPDLRPGTRKGVSQNDLSSSAPMRATRVSLEDEGPLTTSEQKQAIVRDKIAKEMKIKLGTENMLEALMVKPAKQTRDQRFKVEQELGSSNRKLAELQEELDQEIQRSLTPQTPPSKRLSTHFRGSPMRSPRLEPHDEQEREDEFLDVEEESPTVVLTETLEQLEISGMPPEYYIARANRLVDLFKRNPTLKYDIAWSVFSGRVQLMLLSESSDVVAAGYRLARSAIADRASIQTIRKLHTDELVTLSLIKKGRTLVEREQAVKFVRAFFDVKDGVHELSLAVVRSIVAVAEQQDDRLRNVCLLTLSELLTRHPALLVQANGLTALTDSLAEGTFSAPEGLVASFMHVLDSPKRRRWLSSGREFEAMFAPFTDPLLLGGDEEKLRTCAKGISAMLKTWPGFLTLAANNASALRSLVDSLVYPSPIARDLVLELFFDVLRIKQPSWSSSYLAGRRLTTYGRVGSPSEPSTQHAIDDLETDRRDLTNHFTSFILRALLTAGLVPALMDLIRYEEASAMKRKCTLLVTEVLKLASRLLPRELSARIQVLGDLMKPSGDSDLLCIASNTSMIYQMESINRTTNRTGAVHDRKDLDGDEFAVGAHALERTKYTANMDAEAFRLAIIESGVASHTNWTKWNWNLINDLIEGPLTNQKRLEEAIRGSKFMKRLIGFYRPFKWRFSATANTRANRRYVRTGCALIRTLCQTSLGVQYLADDKVLRQIAECLAQLDRYSGLTSTSPLFDKHNMIDYLTGGYFDMLGALSESLEGIQIMERWHIMNMFYHILELDDRADLVKIFLNAMDYTLDTHLRVMLSQCLTAASKEIRLFATKILRKYAIGRMRYVAGLQGGESSQWALKMTLTQLYDPDVEVCEEAVHILEKACDQPGHLEFVVRCRPALDHLGELGASLLLRFLSISTGYRYLSGLDYIHQEMDDWFLGRNDSYVAQVEASLARAYLDPRTGRHGIGKEDDEGDIGLLPPHFYRELARTEEGCKLLLQSGHFHDFAVTIQDFDLADEEGESLLKLKACLWAVGNIGSMELGSPFLEQTDIVRGVIRIAEGAQVASLRGTAILVLGLISRTTHGFAMLSESGWQTTTDSNGGSLGLCFPAQLESICLGPPRPDGGRLIPSAAAIEASHANLEDHDPVFVRILTSVVDMGNSVTYKKVAGELQALRAKHMTAFSSTRLFRKTLSILQSHHYRLPARQFVLDLFDQDVLRQTVLEEDEELESPPA